MWIRSSQKLERDLLTRQRRLARAGEKLNALARKLGGPKARKRDSAKVQSAVDAILHATHTSGLINVAVESKEDATFKQARRGRPTPDTPYVRLVHRRLVLHWSLDNEAIEADAKMDGIFPLITNDRKLPAKEVLFAYKHQPALERRHEQLKSVLEVMPMFLKSSARVEALLFLYFISLLVHAIIERCLRTGMVKAKVNQLPVYPEERGSKRPTTDQVFRLFEDLRCHRLLDDSGAVHQTFTDELTEPQAIVLQFLGLPKARYFQDAHPPS